MASNVTSVPSQAVDANPAVPTSESCPVAIEPPPPASVPGDGFDGVATTPKVTAQVAELAALRPERGAGIGSGSAVCASEVQRRARAAKLDEAVTAMRQEAGQLEAEGDPETARRIALALDGAWPVEQAREERPLALVAGALEGDTEALKSGGRRWKSVTVWAGTDNDNFATRVDGKPRSDSGYTVGFDLGARAEGDHEAAVLHMALKGFTEHGAFSGDGRRANRRIDLLEATAKHLKTAPSGIAIFETVETSWLAGVQATGDFGLDEVQDAMHGLTGARGTRGRLPQYGGLLQDNYTGSFAAALLAGVGVAGERRVGPVTLRLGAEAQTPIGATGIGRAGANAGMRIGGDEGLSLSVETARYKQWTNGDAFAFPGAPVQGWVTTPKVALAWQGNKYGLMLTYTRNAEGTGADLGRGIVTTSGRSIAPHHTDSVSIVISMRLSGSRR